GRFRRVIVTAGAAALFLMNVPAAGAQVVEEEAAAGPAAIFIVLGDAVASKFFDAATTHVDPANANRLLIGFNAGQDPITLVSRAFRVSTLPFENRTAGDTISVLVLAPRGFYVSGVQYAQHGVASTFRTAVQAGTAEWVVDSFPANLGVFTANGNVAGSADLSALKRTFATVSVSVSLFAGPTGSLELTDAALIA